MSDIVSNFCFDHELAFDPNADFESFMRAAPAKPTVYLLSDDQARPVQLLFVRNLRYSLKNRLGPPEPDAPVQPSKRVNYRELVRRVSWRRVDSAFEADVAYLEAARTFFPQTYRGMTGMRPAWFVHVNPDAAFPRYTKTTDLSIATGQLIGPIEDKNAAGKLIEDVADWFDLCRYYHILCEAPVGKACAYKEMGKCPAPCDGSISMDQYRRMIEWSSRAIVEPRELIREHTARMTAAATELRFETAAKIKAYIDSLTQLGAGSYRHLRKLRDFAFLSFQRGPRAHTAKVFLITPGVVEEIADCISEPSRPGEIMRLALELATTRITDTVDATGAERISIVAHHLFQPKAQQGVFLPLDQLDERAIVKAFKDVQKQKVVDDPLESEGVVKELQSL